MKDVQCDLVIVGGGPAGMAAAVAARRYQLDVCVIDEQPRFGGQIYRQPPRDFNVPSWLAGADYVDGKALLKQAEQLPGLQHIAPATVWGCFKSKASGTGHDVLFHGEYAAGRARAQHVLLASGCYEAPVPFPGWHLPGVMSAGAVQTLLKSQRVAAGESVVLAGSHPLLFVVADQLLAAKVHIAAVVLLQPAAAVWPLVRDARIALTGFRQLKSALRTLLALRRARVPVIFGHVVTEALGRNEIEGVRIRDVKRGTEHQISCDALGVCYGFYPSSELARQVGAKHHWAAEGGWVIDTDEYMRSSVAGISVAGELTGVAGAQAAALSGEIAAIGAACDLGRSSRESAQARLQVLKPALLKLRGFASLLARLSMPPEEILRTLPKGSTLVCRCEDIGTASIEAAVRSDPGIFSASAAKLLTRVGMGLCQGRMCESSVRRIIAQVRDLELCDVAGYVVRPPVKPVPVSVLASYPDAFEIDPNS